MTKMTPPHPHMEDDELPSINWFLALSKPNLLAEHCVINNSNINNNNPNNTTGNGNGIGDCQRRQTHPRNSGQPQKRRPWSSSHVTEKCQQLTGMGTRKRGRRCNSAKAKLMPEIVLKIDTGERPTKSNLELVISALEECPGHCGTLNDILANLAQKYAYFKHRQENESLKNSIRHVLSQNIGIFRKIYPPTKNGRGTIWALAEEKQKGEGNITEQQMNTHMSPILNGMKLDEGKADKQQQFLQVSNVDEHNYALKMTMMTNDPLIAENQEFSTFELLADHSEICPNRLTMIQNSRNDYWEEVENSTLSIGNETLSFYQDLDYFNYGNLMMPKEWEDELFFNSGNLS